MGSNNYMWSNRDMSNIAITILKNVIFVRVPKIISYFGVTNDISPTVLFWVGQTLRLIYIDQPSDVFSPSILLPLFIEIWQVVGSYPPSISLPLFIEIGRVVGAYPPSISLPLFIEYRTGSWVLPSLYISTSIHRK